MNVRAIVLDAISDAIDVGVSDADLGKNLVLDLGCDDLDMISILMCVEEDLDIELNDDELYECLTINDVVLLAERLVAAK